MRGRPLRVLVTLLASASALRGSGDPASRQPRKALVGTSRPIEVEPECRKLIPPGFRAIWIRDSQVGPMRIVVRESFRMDIISRFLTNKGFWEIKHPRELAELGKTQLPENGTFVDIGANLGWYSILFAKIGYKVIAIEPMRLNRDAIEATLCLNPDIRDRVKLMPVALVAPEDRNRQCVLFATKTNRGNGILTCAADRGDLPCNATEGRRDGSICEVVRSLTLDQVLKESQIASVDVAKMDVEGFECNVMRGGQSLFDEFHVKILQAETKLGFVADCFAKEARDHGYRIGTDLGQDDNRVMSALGRVGEEEEAPSRTLVTLTKADA
uniref:Methyltransferase FkbM domain-containing protein n=1 Tax=Alexandrium catenella TaxID=2925 RepID=A0A7S1SE34_ALECA